MTKHLTQKKSMINLKGKESRQMTLFFGFEHVYLKVDVKTLVVRN